MKNGITKFVLLIDYNGEYSIKLDNKITQKHIYENVDAYEMVSQIACEIPTEIIEPQNHNLKEEIKRLKNDNHDNEFNLQEKEKEISRLGNKLYLQAHTITESEIEIACLKNKIASLKKENEPKSKELLSFSEWNKKQPKINISKITGGE